METFLLFSFVKMMMKSVMTKEIFGIIHKTVRNAELELDADCHHFTLNGVGGAEKIEACNFLKVIKRAISFSK